MFDTTTAKILFAADRFYPTLVGSASTLLS